jgi:hypothetical protein
VDGEELEVRYLGVLVARGGRGFVPLGLRSLAAGDRLSVFELSSIVAFWNSGWPWRFKHEGTKGQVERGGGGGLLSCVVCRRWKEEGRKSQNKGGERQKASEGETTMKWDGLGVDYDGRREGLNVVFLYPCRPIERTCTPTTPSRVLCQKMPPSRVAVRIESR